MRVNYGTLIKEVISFWFVMVSSPNFAWFKLSYSGTLSRDTLSCLPYVFYHFLYISGTKNWQKRVGATAVLQCIHHWTWIDGFTTRLESLWCTHPGAYVRHSICVIWLPICIASLPSTNKRGGDSSFAAPPTPKYDYTLRAESLKNLSQRLKTSNVKNIDRLQQ